MIGRQWLVDFNGDLHRAPVLRTAPAARSAQAAIAEQGDLGRGIELAGLSTTPDL